ncbi:magnesium transporter, partial [Archaeoglobus sp.]
FLGMSFEKLMLKYPMILIVIPGLMGLRGNVFGSLGSRISTSLYLGSSQPSLGDEYISKNIFFSMWAATIPALILLAVAAVKFFNVSSFLIAVQIVIDSSVLISAILGFVTALIVIQSFKRGIDPDNIVGPAITTFADLVSIPSIVLFIFLFESARGIWVISTFFVVFLFISVYLSFKNGYDRKAYRETVTIISLLALIQSITGNILQEFSGVIHQAMLLSFAYPAIIGSIGNYGSIMVARTSTKLHLGEIEYLGSKKSLSDVLYIFPTTLIIAPAIYLFSLLASTHLANASLPVLTTFVYFLIVYLSLAAAVLIFSTALSVWLYKEGVDPDNGGIPLTTTITDIVGTVVVVLLAYIIA